MRSTSLVCKPNRVVTFGDSCMLVHEIGDEDAMWPSEYNLARDPAYKHKRRPNSEEATRGALEQASRLMTEVFEVVPSLGSARNRSPEKAMVGRRGDAFSEQNWLGPTEWLMDSGSAVDLIAHSGIPQHHARLIVPLGHKLEL